MKQKIKLRYVDDFENINMPMKREAIASLIRHFKASDSITDQPRSESYLLNLCELYEQGRGRINLFWSGNQFDYQSGVHNELYLLLG